MITPIIAPAPDWSGIATDAIDLDLGGGYSIQRRFNFDRADLDYKTDPAPYLRLLVKAEF